MALLLALLCTTISATVLVVACIGGQGPTDYRTRHGIRVYGERVLSREVVEMSTHAVINEARAADPRYTATRLRGLRHCSIEFVDGLFPCGYEPSNTCSGVFYLHDCRMKIALVGNECDDTALVHEQVHMLNSLVENTLAERVQSHSSAKWFFGRGSVLHKANRTLGAYCGSSTDSEDD